ncbi:MAG TPA: hypothetical protein PLZ51_07405 [Aggregatilineales bacterium]|nr:hypothetical protein [Aggregatilineales bacterium]
MNTPLKQILSLALDLTPVEQAKLIEQLASHLATQFPETPQTSQKKEHWGRKVIAFLESIDEDDWADIDDPVEWIKIQRRASEQVLDWGDEE